MSQLDVGEYLRNLRVQCRTYRADRGYGEAVADYHERCLRYRDGRAAHPAEYNRKTKLLRSSDVWVPGPGQHGRLAQEWGITLREDYLAFSAEYTQYVLVRRIAIWIFPPHDVREVRQMNQRVGKPTKGQPSVIYPFAGFVDREGIYAFRQISPLETDVVLFDAGMTSEVELMGPQAARFHSDATFSDWLVRLVETDGLPDQPGAKIERHEASVVRVL